MVIVYVLISILTAPVNSKDIDITFIDVGQGLSIFMKTENNTYLIDGGGKYGSDSIKK